jgi:chromosome segregation ATPase
VLTPANDERLTEVLDLTRHISEAHAAVKESIQEALLEFGSLAYRSRDNGVALTELQERSKLTEDAGIHMKSVFEEGVLRITSSLETQREGQRAISTIADSLLESSQNVFNTLRAQESYLKSLDRECSTHNLSDLTIKLESHHEEIIKMLAVIRDLTEFRRKNVDDDATVLRSVDAIPDVVRKAMDSYAGRLDSLQAKLNEFDGVREKLNDLDHVREQLHGLDKLDSLDHTLSELHGLDAKLDGLSSLVKNNLSAENHHELSTLIEQLQELGDRPFRTSLLDRLEDIRNTISENRGVNDLLEKLRVDRTNQSGRMDTLVEKMNEIGTNEQLSVNRLSDIQADIRSLIDLQYGDMAKFKEQIDSISRKLEDRVDEYKREAQESNATAEQLKKAVEDSERSVMELRTQNHQLLSDFKLLKYHDKNITQQEDLVDDLKRQVDVLTNEKLTLSGQVEAMKSELAVRMDSFSRLEARAEAYEKRLHSTILDRSKGILGSTTMAIISNNGTGNDSPDSFLLARNPISKRNLSLAPTPDKDEPDGLGYLGKENELTIAKRGSPFAKGRSVSMSIDP